ncbi:hypothetical protein, partial [Paenibacillus ginsengarvi]|uniref:hypothetical protein n=1 Tax=Paenibacillus ginsengarvi TaxID=400777 RepID=UPI001960E6FE
AKMGVAHVGFSCEKWCCGDFHFTRIHSWASLFLVVALHITIRLNTEQKYGFRLVNISDKKVKLLRIELVDYQGIMISDLRINGKPFTAQLIPSHRVYSSTKSWSTNSQGVDVD